MVCWSTFRNILIPRTLNLSYLAASSLLDTTDGQNYDGFVPITIKLQNRSPFFKRRLFNILGTGRKINLQVFRLEYGPTIAMIAQQLSAAARVTLRIRQAF